ncbi:MAG: hypothetical protein ACHRHE_03040 [Tepidisphaerales bacterium]
MALHPAEEATILAFVVPAKRERLLGLLGSRKRRKQALDSLNHFTGWDPRYMQSLPSSSDMVRALRQAGAPDACHVISDARELDGRDLPLADAVAAAETHDFATVLCCLPGKVACFFDEVYAPRNRVLLRRDVGARSRT